MPSSSQDAAALADALTHNTSVLSIDFRYNKVGDYGAKLIAEALINCPSIGELRITPNDIPEAGAQVTALATHASCNILPRFTMRSNPWYKWTMTRGLSAQALKEAAEMCQFQAMSVSSATLAQPEHSLAPIMVRMR